MTREELIALLVKHDVDFKASASGLDSLAAALKADERGSAEPFPYSKPLAELVPIGFASVVDIEAYKTTLEIGPHLLGVRDVAMFTKDQLKAACNAADTAQARDAALEEAARAAESERLTDELTLPEDQAYNSATQHAAAAIRALKGTR